MMTAPANYTHVVAFPSVHWDFNWERQHNVITHFSRNVAGRVIIHAPYGLINHNPKVIFEKWQDRSKSPPAAPANPRVANMSFVQPKFVPVHYIPVVDKLNASLIQRASEVALSESLGYFTYVNGALLKLMSEFSCSILDIAQRRQAIPELSPAAKETERRAVRRADIVVVDSITTLNDYKNDRKDIHYLPQGVDVARFEKGRVPETLQHWKKGFTSIIGYAGSDLAVDVPYLEQLIRELPHCGFLLVGQFDRPEMQALAAYSNTFFVGRIAFDALPNYYAAMDIGIIPYALTPRILGVFPTKFFEYLAFGMPVISTALPDLLPFATNEIVISNHPKEAVRHIENLQQLGWNPTLIKAQLHQHTWQRRFAQLDHIIEAHYNSKRQ